MEAHSCPPRGVGIGREKGVTIGSDLAILAILKKTK